MFKAFFPALIFAALSAAPAHAAFIVSKDGNLPAQPKIIHAAPATMNVYSEIQSQDAASNEATSSDGPLLAAIPAEEVADTSSDAPGSGFAYTTVVDTSAAERLPGATGAYDNFNAFHNPFANAAEAVYHTSGNPAAYRGAPYQNYRGYGNISGYTNNYGGYNNYYGYRGGYSY